MSKVLLDTNTLLLLIVGNLDLSAIGRKKLQTSTVEDFQNLMTAIKAFSLHITTPHILTETSNHLGSGNQLLVANSDKAFAKYAANVSEVYEPSAKLCENFGHWLRDHGLADAAILLCAKERDVTVFTSDAALYHRLFEVTENVVNILHHRKLDV